MAMKEYRAKLGENGRVIIPVTCRKMLDLQSGEELILHVVDNELHITSLKQSLQKAQLLVQSYAKQQSLTKILRELRNKDE